MRRKRKEKKHIVRHVRMVPRGDGLEVVTTGARYRIGDIYARMLGLPWWRVAIAIVLWYVVANMLFALGYLLIGNGIKNAITGSFADAFFFSVQTMATIGYGDLSPVGIPANLLVLAEAITGFGFFAVVTGIVFSKFSRPTARVMFSDKAVIVPYNGVPHLMIRMANERGNRIVNATIDLVMLRRTTTEEGHTMRRFHDIKPERGKAPILRYSWTCMHKIDKESPLYKMDTQALTEVEAEIIISIAGIDDTLSQVVHARHSYIAEEIAFDSVFEDVVHVEGDRLEVNYHNFHAIKPFKAKK